MTEHDPERRPSAPSALAMFRQIHAKLDPASMRWRLHPRDESVVRNTLVAAFGALKRAIGNT